MPDQTAPEPEHDQPVNASANHPDHKDEQEKAACEYC